MRAKGNQLLQSIIDNGENNNAESVTAEEIIKVAAYIQIGKKQKAEELVKKWLASYPDDPFAQWTSLWLDGDTKAFNIETSPNKGVFPQKIGSKEYYLQWVVNFLIKNSIKI